MNRQRRRHVAIARAGHRDHLPLSLIAGLSLLVLSGCTALPRNPVPVEDIQRAEIPGMSGVRAWAGQIDAIFQADLVASVAQEPPGVYPLDEDGYPIYHGLALSGGGSNGAFGAGILNGWSEAGERPHFKLVTSISSGALIAPFAFLGPEYDTQLKAVYTTRRAVMRRDQEFPSAVIRARCEPARCCRWGSC